MLLASVLNTVGEIFAEDFSLLHCLLSVTSIVFTIYPAGHNIMMFNEWLENIVNVISWDWHTGRVLNCKYCTMALRGAV